MDTLHETQRGVKTEGVPIDPLASTAAEAILAIFDQLPIDTSEINYLKIPVVSAYVKGMQTPLHDSKDINPDRLKDQIHLVLARELARRQAPAGKKTE